MPQAYGDPPGPRQPPLPDSLIVAGALCTVLGIEVGLGHLALAAVFRVLIGVVLGAGVVLVVAVVVGERMGAAARRRWALPAIRVPRRSCDRASAKRRLLALALVALAATAAGARAKAVAQPAATGAISGWGELVTDPEPRFGATSAIVDLGGNRLIVDAYGSSGRRLRRMLAGERVMLTGRIGRLDGRQAERLAHRHVRGRLNVEVVGDRAPERPVARAANRLRRALVRGAGSMPAVERSLFAGLVIGDDRDEPPELIEAFRRSGLSHLTAVSGQNIGFLLVAAGPLLRRLRPAPRWAATIALVAWFALLTRFEPSVLRAGAMAMLSATAFWRGWQASPLRLLSLCVTVLLFVDPMLITSIGWWLSVGATVGIAVLGPPLARRIPGPRWLAEPTAASLGAQVGVLPTELLVFDRVPLAALPANLLAGGAAGLVMVWGIPAALLAAIIPPLGPVVLWPCLIATRWVIRVAQLAAAADPGWPAWVGGTLHVLCVIFMLCLTQRRFERH